MWGHVCSLFAVQLANFLHFCFFRACICTRRAIVTAIAYCGVGCGIGVGVQDVNRDLVRQCVLIDDIRQNRVLGICSIR